MNTNETLSLNKKLTLTGAFSALVIVLGITKLGFISLGPTASITILHIPVILICMLAGLPEGLFVGLVFGSLSLIQAAMSPTGALDPFFVNPLISVLPRMIIAVIAWGLWKIFTNVSKLSKENIIGVTTLFLGLSITVLTNVLPTGVGVGVSILIASIIWLMLNNASKIPVVISAGVTAFLTTVAHTLLVLGFLYLFKGTDVRNALGGVGYFALVGMCGFNAILEAIAATILCAAVFAGLFVAGKKHSKLSEEK